MPVSQKVDPCNECGNAQSTRISVTCDSRRCKCDDGKPTSYSWLVEQAQHDVCLIPEGFWNFISSTTADNRTKHFCCVRCEHDDQLENPDWYKSLSPRQRKLQTEQVIRNGQIAADRAGIPIASTSPFTVVPPHEPEIL